MIRKVKHDVALQNHVRYPFFFKGRMVERFATLTDPRQATPADFGLVV